MKNKYNNKYSWIDDDDPYGIEEASNKFLLINYSAMLIVAIIILLIVIFVY